MTCQFSGALKEALREKELHVDQLLKERDMERAEIAKAANQTDVAETELNQLKQEFDAFKKNHEEVKEELSKMREVEKDFTLQLEEEKRL